LLNKSAEDVELIKGGNGVFEVFADGELVFSKKELGRFPSDEEIDALIAS
jgi:selT/selW/selH-like putative selenoprotein